jgi:hypothetical protein
MQVKQGNKIKRIGWICTRHRTAKRQSLKRLLFLCLEKCFTLFQNRLFLLAHLLSSIKNWQFFIIHQSTLPKLNLRPNYSSATASYTLKMAASYFTKLINPEKQSLHTLSTHQKRLAGLRIL